MRRTVSVLLMLVLLLSLLVGCSTSGYKLVCEDGNYYIILDYSFPEPIGSSYNGTLYYDSLDEMVRDLKKGRFTEEELEHLTRHPKTEDGKIYAPNLDALVEPIVPEDLEAHNVYQRGSYYAFKYKNSADGSTVSVGVKSVQGHEGDVSSFMNRASELSDREEFAVTQAPERNATVFTWVANGNNCKYVQYTITANETVYYVEERYDHANNNRISTIYIWFQCQGVGVQVSVTEPTERPTEQWLSGFSVKPYEG